MLLLALPVLVSSPARAHDAAETGLVHSYIVTAGLVPDHEWIIHDYWGEGSELKSRSGAIAATYEQGRETLGLLGQLDAMGEIFVDQAPSDYTQAKPLIGYDMKDLDLSPLGAKGQVSFLVDPTTKWFSHKLGSGGAWTLGVGFSPSIELSKATYLDHDGHTNNVSFTSAYLPPTVGLHMSLFNGIVSLGWQGMLTPAQLGVWNLMNDTSASTALDGLAADGKLPDPGDAAKDAGLSGVLARSAGTGRFGGSTSSTFHLMLGIPHHSNVFNTAYGIGLTWYGANSWWVPFGSEWNPNPDQPAFKTENHGLLIALAFRSAVRE